MEKFKQFLAIAAFCFVFVTLFPATVHGEECVSEKTGLDVIFVMDYSGSMNSNDPEHIAKSMVKAFIDTVHSTDIRIGFVSYNDRILSSTSPLPVGTVKEREKLKQLIDGAEYSGNTDIGLGLRYACGLMGQESERKKMIVLISDGESDLKGSATGRVLENSETDVNDALNQCKEQGIPIDTIAFGNYDGSTQKLAQLSEQTEGQAYTVKTPEDLIGILYGIFSTNMDYSIQEITSGIYAQGKQNIRLKLDEAYLDELDVLMISPQTIGTVNVLYGSQQIEPVNLSHYAVAKITSIDSQIHEMTVQAETIKNQGLKIYLVSYRSLTPVLKVSPSVYKNSPLDYQVYFKDKNGSVVTDGDFYKNFTCNLDLEKTGSEEAGKLNTSIRAGVIGGEVTLAHSGTYQITGQMDDSMGSCAFGPVSISVQNRKPAGKLPDHVSLAIFGRKESYELNDYFKDPDGDILTYTLSPNNSSYVKAELENGVLTVKAQKSGKETLNLVVSDGEEQVPYSWAVTVTPLWLTYWWVIVLMCISIAAILWKLFNKPKPELLQITEKKMGNRFAGKVDAYVTAQPEGTQEIPPLTFPMYKIKEARVSIGDLMKEYPKISDCLGLDLVFLIADEDRKMVLYHSTPSTVMLGGSIVCRQLQYCVSFGDIIYITSSDGLYELELHYIALIQ